MKLFNWFADLLWPPRCPFCQELLKPGEAAVCDRCALELAKAVPGEKDGNWFSGCLYALAYDDRVRQAILAYKFQSKTYYARAFGQVLGDAIVKKQIFFDTLSWVPVSPARKKQRGYDQAELLCQWVGKHLGVHPTALLIKKRDNPAQSTMQSMEARSENVKGVYSAAQAVQGKRVLLIDDIVTTGSTLSEASRTLLLAGVESVHCAALAGSIFQQQGGCYVESVEGPGN